MECIVQVVDGKKTAASRAWQLPMSKMIQDLEIRLPATKGKVTPESMRDLYSHAYNPRRNEGFFAFKIVLVEGTTEEYSLPIYAEALPNCAFDPQGISAVECGGKGSMDRLFRIFNELHIPCFMLFDYDKGNSDEETIRKSKELLALTGQSQEAPSSLLVANGVACFPRKWETDLKSEIADCNALEAAARNELGLSNDTGKPLIARYIARKLTSRNPPFVPPTLKKIIEKAITVTWEKSCVKAPDLPATSLTATSGGQPA